MKRLLPLIVAAIAFPAVAFTTNPRPGDRISVLRVADRFAYGAEQTIATTVQNRLRRELSRLGFKAFDAGITYDELLRNGPGDADYYVEILSSQASGRPVAGVGGAVGGVAVDVGVVMSTVAAEVRLYDGKTLNLIDSYDLQKTSTAVVPTGIGIAGRQIWAAIALPFVQFGQFRSAEREVAHRAALWIAGQ